MTSQRLQGLRQHQSDLLSLQLERKEKRKRKQLREEQTVGAVPKDRAGQLTNYKELQPESLHLGL